MNAEPFRALRADIYNALKPPPHIDMVEWIEATVRLPATTAEAGRMRLMAWQREVARSIGDPRVERVSIIKPARIGATQLMIAGMAHYALNDPAPQLLVMPSESDCRMLMTDAIDPTFEASPALRHALSTNASGRDNMLSRRYPGGSLALISGASPKNLRARTARVLWIDEVDGLEISAGEEGDPVSLAIRRTMSFGSKRKIVMASSPVDEATSRIARAYEQGDQRIWELPCPHCDEWHELAWSMIQWPSGKPEDAYFACPSCGAITEESGRVAMINKGRWRATRPEVIGHHSYRLNTFGASTLEAAAWGVLAQEFVDAKRDPMTLKTWVNTVAGQVWRDDSQGIELGDLMDRVEPIGLDRIDPAVIILTGGVDIQQDRAELSTIGWTSDGQSLVLEHSIIWGDPYGDDLWRDLHDLLARSFAHPGGGTLRYDAAMIDSGFATKNVYDQTRGYASKRIFPCKGNPGFKEVPAKPGKAAGDKSIRLHLIGTDPLKQRIMGMVQAGTIRFSDTLTPEWFDQLTAERLRTRYVKGFPILEWHKVRARNEALDCLTYAMAARSVVNLNTDRRAEELASAAAPKKAPAVIRSRWLTGG